MSKIRDLNAYEAAPTAIRDIYKFYQKLPRDQLESDPGIIDFRRGLDPEQQRVVHLVGTIPRLSLNAAYGQLGVGKSAQVSTPVPDVSVYEVDSLPGELSCQNYVNKSDDLGLRLIPSLLCGQAQERLLSILLHDNLANQRHKTNVHLHHRIPYYATLLKTCGASERKEDGFVPSFFRISPDSTEKLFTPLDEVVHNPFTVSQFLSRKLRWLTLGGQFDWTGKRYPLEDEPPFPTDIGNFISSLFPYMKPQAAIVNIYRPGDVLSVHRDVSEESDNALVSFSLGCEAILVAGLHYMEGEKPRSVAIRLCSGDAICLSGQARFAWHGVPQVLQGTSPDWLRNWPADANTDVLSADSPQRYEAWRGWMLNKRVNLSVRQIRD